MLLTHHSTPPSSTSATTTGIASTSTSSTMAAANLRIAAATPPLLLLLLLLLLLILPTTTTAAASSSLRRRQQQQEQQQPSQGVEPAAPLVYYPSGMNKGRLAAISPRAASELLQHALLYDDFTGVVTDDGSDGGGNDDDEQMLLPAPLGKTEANTTCIMEYCVDAAKACFLERPCRAALECLSACDTIEDDTPDKIILQNCTAFCVNTYEDAALDDVNGCFDSHGCITLEPIDLPCRDTTEAAAAQPVADMEGQWWVTHGFNPVYDCLPCQRLTFSKLNASSWLYDSKYQAITLEGAPRDFEVQAVFPWPADGTAQAIAFTYEYEGMTHGETWKFLHVDPELVLLYYCGNSNTWNYEGALVLSRQRSNTEEHLGMAAEAFARIGLAFPAQFCALDNAACEGF